MSLSSKLAIVVVTHNRRESLLRTLAHLHDLEAAFPMVVVDNASTDGTAAAVQKHFPQVQMIQRSDNIGAVARNDGVQVVKQPFVAFADDDSWWARGALSKAVELFQQQPRLGLIMSRILVGEKGRLDPCCELMSRTPLPRAAGAPGVPGFPILGFVACGAVVRRAAFLGVNGFNEFFGTSGEEGLLAIDMACDGWYLRYVPEVVSHHHPSPMRLMKGRYIDGVCNQLWLAWLRRPVQRAVEVTLATVSEAFRDDTTRRGLLAALGGMNWVLKARRPVPPAIEEQLEMLEKQLDEE